MKWKFASLALVLAVLGAFVMAPVATRAAEADPIAPIPVEASKKNKSFDGEWTITRFVEQDGALFAEGVLTGEVTNKHGKVTKTVEETVLLPVTVRDVSSASAGAVRAQATGDLRRARARARPDHPEPVGPQPLHRRRGQRPDPHRPRRHPGRGAPRVDPLRPGRRPPAWRPDRRPAGPCSISSTR